MNNLMRNLENVVDQANAYSVDSRELKTLMNTYRTLLQRVPSRGISNEHLHQFDNHKESLKSTLESVECKINDKLKQREFKYADDYAEVTYRITKALVDINSILRDSVVFGQHDKIIENIVVKNGKVSLSQIPIKDRYYNVSILDAYVSRYEVENKSEIAKHTFFVDYDFGDVYVHDTDEGKTLRIGYSGKGGNLKYRNDWKTIK